MEKKMLYTVRECVEVLRLSRAYVYSLISAGILPSVRMGSKILVRATDLETIIKNGMRGVTIRSARAQRQ